MSEVPERIRRAASRAAAGPLADAVQHPWFPMVASESPFPPTAGLDDLVARFRLELEALAGKVHGPFDAEGVSRIVVELVQGIGNNEPGTEAEGGVASELVSDASGRGQGSPTEIPGAPGLRPLRVLAWSPSELGCPGLGEALERASIELVPGDVPNDERHHAALERLAELPVGLTGAIAGLADTGSIVVRSGPGRARVASLLPPVHVAVLPVSRLYPTLPDWLADGGAELLKGSANVVAITGPSRTADIELTLALGMHGPKEIHVVLYSPAPSPLGRGSG